MTQPDLSQHILNTIHDKKLQPHAKWHFQLKHSALWLAVLTTIGVASLAIGTTFSIVHTSDWDLYRQSGQLSRPVFLFLLSYFWIALLSVCLLGTYLLFIHTRHGYRYRLLPFTVLIGIFGIFIGGFIFRSGVGQNINEQCERIVPGYGVVLSQSHQLWVQPDKGRLAGIVEHIKAPIAFTVIDPYGHLWLVQTDYALTNTVLELQEKKTVHMTGYKIDNSTFHAREIRMYQLPNSFIFFKR